jgi:site-specific DNA-methyltransferase (adenine-specific)
LTVIHGNAVEVLRTLPEESIDLIFTSPSPLGHDDYGIGSLTSSEKYIRALMDVFEEVNRVLKQEGSIYLEMGDYHYYGDLPCIPEQLLLQLKRLYYVRSKLIWHRTEKFEMQEEYNRFARDWEYLYFLTKSKDHYFNNPKNKILYSILGAPYEKPTGSESGFPKSLIAFAISKSCPPNGVVLDPFGGTGTTGVVAKEMNRDYIMIDLNFDRVLEMRARLDEK